MNAALRVEIVNQYVAPGGVEPDVILGWLQNSPKIVRIFDELPHGGRRPEIVYPLALGFGDGLLFLKRAQFVEQQAPFCGIERVEHAVHVAASEAGGQGLVDLRDRGYWNMSFFARYRHDQKNLQLGYLPWMRTARAILNEETPREFFHRTSRNANYKDFFKTAECPKGACPVLFKFAAVLSTVFNSATCTKLAHAVDGSFLSRDACVHRTLYFLDQAFRTYLPFFIRAYGYELEAARLEDLPRLQRGEALNVAERVIDDIRDAMANDGVVPHCVQYAIDGLETKLSGGSNDWIGRCCALAAIHAESREQAVNDLFTAATIK